MKNKHEIKEKSINESFVCLVFFLTNTRKRKRRKKEKRKTIFIDDIYEGNFSVFLFLDRRTKRRFVMGTSQSQYDDEDQRKESRMRHNDELVRDLANHDERVGAFPNLFHGHDGNNQHHQRQNQNLIQIDGKTYEIENYINEGGFGKIFKGKQTDSNRSVAIKVMPNTHEIRQDIENEINFLKLIRNIRMENHPVIEYFGRQINPDRIYIAMELAHSDLLTFWFNQIKQTNAEQRFTFGLAVIIYVLRALIFLEKLNLIHGDIKPQNLVIVTRPNQTFSIKLIDFGTIEKMFTKRNQLTVDITKAHTIFFASPEFLKRDSNNLMKRHLHKKSDAWAAGVMFYILFFEQLPWKDQYDYENFCNNPHAKDIRVPKQGGFQLIIELLLKKDPNERASAKDTFMQMKSHPNMSQIIQSIQRKFFPADDVLRIVVPDQVKQQLAKFGKQASSTTNGLSLFFLFSSFISLDFQMEFDVLVDTENNVTSNSLSFSFFFP